MLPAAQKGLKDKEWVPFMSRGPLTMPGKGTRHKVVDPSKQKAEDREPVREGR